MLKLLTHPATTALGFTSLYLLSGTAQLVARGHVVIYHWSGPVSGLVLPILLDFCLLWLVLTFVLSIARTTGRWSVAIWSGLVLPLPWVLFKTWVFTSDRPMPPRLNMLLLGLTFAAIMLVVAGWHPKLAPAFERVRRMVATALGFVAVTALFSLGQIGWLGWQARDLNAALPLHPRRTTGAPMGPRIIWVLFDELSYQQVYERRYPGLLLPAFDRLASQSTQFTHAVPAGKMTEKVIPSLFTGRQVEEIKVSGDGRRLFLHNRDAVTWERFDPHGTVFEDALNAGYSTAIAGWYNPYCRIMPQVLDQCSWALNTSTVAGVSSSRSVAGNFLLSVHHEIMTAAYLYNQLRHVPTFDTTEASLHWLDYTRISSSADRLLEDRSVNFVFLHMPLPHPGGFYNRATGDLATDNATYIDNLALADRNLAHVRSLLEQSGDWDRSVIIVMGDHSWRTHIWKASPTWTPEEQAASDGGQFDDRPVYLVKLPHQQQPARIESSYAAIHTRALLDALMHKRIQSADDLSAWAAAWNTHTGQASLTSGM